MNESEMATLRAENEALRREVERLRVVETEHARMRDSLLESEGRYRSVVEALDDGVVLHDHDGHIIAWNASAERVLGLTADQLNGRTSLDPRWRCVHPDGSPFPGEEHPGRKSLVTGETYRGVIMGVHKPDGTLSWISVNSRPVERSGGAGRYSVVASFCDITKQVANRTALEASEARLRQMLAEKETLLRELHHRTRNNMSVIRAMLSIRALSNRPHTLREILSDVEDRIRAMEIVHSKLYQSPDLSQVDLSSYIEELLPLLFASHGVSREDVRVELSTTPVRVSVDAAVPFGLVVVEVVSNALKHAFPADRQGNLRVELVEHGAHELELLIADDGIGIAQEPAVGESLGLRTVAQLVEHQLQGSFTLDGTSGVTFRMHCDPTAYFAENSP